ncbi:hypothetical protein PHSY_006909 [Pseudozyma hubeiensis SY62]|uniref:Uncharacterized protein n=1 Tax=Pseudozyma hubeiensis (strain SY62) TaxID=1305764 RepID=R9PD56_PSEHS|nr:hypothetical protein PHSY_006909 [Pseudozyma hubeiensis SY62]GAC99308.1 hypothetical protein PHSY_006909 [Pseudozyma hubeiensis SY62]
MARPQKRESARDKLQLLTGKCRGEPHDSTLSLHTRRHGTLVSQDVSHALSFTYIPTRVQSRAATGNCPTSSAKKTHRVLRTDTFLIRFPLQADPPAFGASPPYLGNFRPHYRWSFREPSINEVAFVVGAASLAPQRAVKCQTSIEVPNHTRLVSSTRNTIFGSHVSTIFATPLS